MKNLILILLIFIILYINNSEQNPKNDKNEKGNQNNKHNNGEESVASRFDSSVEIEDFGKNKKDKPNKKDKNNDSNSGSSSEENDDNTPPIHHGKGKKNKTKKPSQSERTLKWKPKKPKNHPPPHEGFSGYRPNGWGKGGHAYNDRGEKEQRKSQKKYEEYMRDIFGDEDYDDNDVLTPEDLNGREIARPGEYPHAAAIGIEIVDSETKMIEWKCGGSLIAEQFILTAAHCTDFGGDSPTHVEIGDIYLTKIEQNTKPQRIRIAEIFPHPDYNEKSYYYDIALLKLRNPAKFTKFVRPVRLWSSDDIPYETVFAMGYGATKFGHASTNILTYFNFTLIGNEECNNTFPPMSETEFGIIDSQVCAMDRIGTKDTCQGDSGGPLQLNLPGRKRPRYSLVGITSYGLFCGSRTPSVYTRIFSYLDWIENLIWPDETQIKPVQV